MSRDQWTGCLALMLFAGISAACGAQPFAQASEAAPSVPAGLPRQELAAGECGAFFWDRAEPNPLRLFENESRGQARLWLEGEILELGTVPRTDARMTGQRFSRTYRLPSDDIITLEGEVTAIREDEAVVGRAVLRRTLPGGATEVSPLMGLISCRDGASSEALSD